MTINSWITENYKQLQDAARTITGNNQLKDDLLHYAIETLLSKPHDVIEACLASGGVNFYIIRVMMIQWRSTTGPFYLQYRKLYDDESALTNLAEESDADEQEYILTTANAIQKELDNLDWYSRELFNLHHLDGISISEISRSTKIPRTSISLTLKRVKTHIKNKL